MKLLRAILTNLENALYMAFTTTRNARRRVEAALAVRRGNTVTWHGRSWEVVSYASGMYTLQAMHDPTMVLKVPYDEVQGAMGGKR